MESTLYFLRLPVDLALVVRYLQYYIPQKQVFDNKIIFVDASECDLSVLSESERSLLKHAQYYCHNIYIFTKKISITQFFFSFNLTNCCCVIGTHDLDPDWRALSLITLRFSCQKIYLQLIQRNNDFAHPQVKRVVNVKTSILGSVEAIASQVKSDTKSSELATVLNITGNLTLDQRRKLMRLLGDNVVIGLDSYLKTLWSHINPQAKALWSQRALQTSSKNAELITVKHQLAALPEAHNIILQGTRYQPKEWVAAILMMSEITKNKLAFRLPIKVSSLMPCFQAEISAFVFCVIDRTKPSYVPQDPLSCLFANLVNPDENLLPQACEIDQMILSNQHLGMKYQYTFCTGTKAWHLIPLSPSVKDNFYLRPNINYKCVPCNSTVTLKPKITIKFKKRIAKYCQSVKVVFCASWDSWYLKSKQQLVDKLHEPKQRRKFIVVCRKCEDWKNPLLVVAKAVIYQSISASLYQWLILNGVIPLKLAKNQYPLEVSNKSHKCHLDFAKLHPGRRIKCLLLSHREPENSFFVKYDVTHSEHQYFQENLWAAPDSNQQPTDYESGALPLS